MARTGVVTVTSEFCERCGWTLASDMHREVCGISAGKVGEEFTGVNHEPGAMVPNTEVKVRAVGFGDFLFDGEINPPAVWGSGDEILAVKEEPTLIVSPTGVGKTTLAGNMLLRRVGLRDDHLLGYPVAVDNRPVLYIAGDRPAQIRRAMLRMVSGEDERDELNARVTLWKGPPPFDMGKDPEGLVRMATKFGVGTVILDSLKDMATKLTDDEVGNTVNRSWQLTTLEGIEVIGLHHQRKGAKDGRKPNSLDDVYGSTWLTAGTGSVVLLWGEVGDPMVELSMMKKPSTEVGPLRVVIDSASGRMEVEERADYYDLLRVAPAGLTAKQAAKRAEGSESRKEVERARRQLEKLAKRGVARREDGALVEDPGLDGRRPRTSCCTV